MGFTYLMQIILDPDEPITWTCKPYKIQGPTTSDALGGLCSTPGPSSLTSSGSREKDGQSSQPHSLSVQNESDENEKRDKTNMKFVGIFLAAISGLFFTLCSVTVKLLPHIAPSEVCLYGGCVESGIFFYSL